jgi:hypothetical protein
MTCRKEVVCVPLSWDIVKTSKTKSDITEIASAGYALMSKRACNRNGTFFLSQPTQCVAASSPELTLD